MLKNTRLAETTYANSHASVVLANSKLKLTIFTDAVVLKGMSAPLCAAAVNLAPSAQPEIGENPAPAAPLALTSPRITLNKVKVICVLKTGTPTPTRPV
jgi:hypothetical protein